MSPPNQKPDQPTSATRVIQAAKLADVLRKIERILTTDDASAKGLANAAGLDPRRDFRGIYLNGVPLIDQDLRGFDFSGSDLRNTGIERAKRDHTTIFEFAIFDGPSLDHHVIAFNKRLKSLRFDELEAELSKAIEGGQRRFDVVSLTTAVGKAPTLARAEHWYREMLKVGIAPNVFTFSALINKSADEERAAYWHGEMQKAGVAPDQITHSILEKKRISDG